ncbi:hypothetical protein BDV06DRAFT_170808 [Aspergillus oleicola]
MTTNPSVIFYQGLRCTKVPRQPRATDFSASLNEENTPSSTSTDAQAALETSAEATSTDELSSDRYSSSEDAANVPVTTTSISSPSAAQTTSQELESHSPGLDTGIHSTSTDHSLTHTTFTTKTATSQPTTSSDPVPSASDDDSGGPPYATIFGILFGILGFLILITLIIFFILRRRNRQMAEEPQDDRSSANSRTGLRRDFRSQMSYISDASPAPSTLLPDAPPMRLSDKYPQNQIPVRGFDPFVNMTEAQPGPKSFVVPIITQRRPTDPDDEIEDHAQPGTSHTPNRVSSHSATSLGSTLILPGRSSIGSEYQGLNPTYPRSPSSGSSYTRPFPQPADTSPRSGSFDLGNSQNGTVVSRRSSGIILGGLL